MSKKSQIYRADEYESASEPELDTLIGRNRTKPPLKKKITGKENRAQKKKTTKPKKSATPRKKRERAQSAPPGHTGHDIWLSAVKNRHTVGLLNHRPESPRHKTPTEYWVDTLRRTGSGISTESTGTNTFSGLRKPLERDMPYLSTSSFLRQMAGVEKPRKHDNPTTKPPMGTPAYKSPEEYYDQILELKKQIQNLNQDNAQLKAKVRRTEEDNIKKEKEIDGLLNPSKSEEMRRTLGDRRPDSGAMIHSLKQKILKLETQLKDKESAYAKLQSDLKTTKIDEMKVQLETCYHEIVRLQQSKDTGIEKSVRSKSESGKMDKAVKDTILRLNKQIEELKFENQGLKKDLNKDLDDTGDYEDMDRKQLLAQIRKLDKKVEKLEKKSGDTDSLVSTDSRQDRRTEREGKIQLKGSVEERLDQLDRRETELLDEISKQKETIKRLKVYRQRCDEKEKEIQALYDELDAARGGQSARRTPRKSPVSSRPPSGRKSPTGRRSSLDSTTSEDRRQKKIANDFRENKAALKIQQGWKKKNERERQMKEVERMRETHAAKTIQKEWHKYRSNKDETEKKVQSFKENRAARKIQHEWTQYRHCKREQECDEAAELIQCTMRGHRARKRRIQRYEDDTDSYPDDEEYGKAVTLIQSSFKGHVNRKNRLRKSKHALDDDDIYDDDHDIGYSMRPPSSGSYRQRPSSALSRGSIASRRSSGSITGKTTVATYPTSRTYESHDDDDDIEF